MNIPLIVVTGPTASGKTGFAAELAEYFNAEVVSADSMQIYRHMDIGTAKPSEKEMRGIKHHMIDIAEPGEDFSVSQYCDMASKAIEDIHSKGKRVIIAGGTGLYIDSLINGTTFGEGDINIELRNDLEHLARIYGNEYLVNMLAEFDEVSAARIHKNNLRRIIRAIEFYKMNGIPISEHQSSRTTGYDRTIKFIINHPREVLYERINHRVDIMIESGLFEEAERLYRKGVLKGTALAGIGYKEVIMYLRGFSSFGETVELIKRGSRRYAKRQLTWFRRSNDIIYLDPEEDFVSEAKTRIGEFLNET
ncbi:MAG: tRNA (adenosine(37)-N6)-dimethylallyltransferase MiaA [Oscillospiraceae bacterium]|nr:tRNA (adenosine(37)-N6)-dimethylallyltransferase MiaA [Oscillospiraceae bacterium]